MKPMLSEKSFFFKRNKSPVREIMDYADPKYFKKLGLNPTDVISFAGGWVNHSSPKELMKEYQELVMDEDKFHLTGGYSPTLGLASCRESIVKYEKAIYGVSELTKENVAVGSSSTQLLADLMKILLSPSDKILLLDPAYCNFPSQIITTLDAEILRFPILNPDTWKYSDQEKVEEFVSFIIQEKPKVVLLVSPDNPSSQVLSDKFVKEALRAIIEVGGFLLVDFAYKDLIFGEDKPEYYSWGPTENYLSVHSHSKWSRSLGRRLGWIEADSDIISSLESIQGTSILAPDTLHQMALANYFEKSIVDGSLKKYIVETSQKYQLAAKRTAEAIEKHLGFPYLTSAGGLYTCIKVPGEGAKFVEDVLKNTGVLFVPGWGFGRTCQNAVRVSFGPLVNDLDKIDEAFKRVGKYIKESNYNEKSTNN